MTRVTRDLTPELRELLAGGFPMDEALARLHDLEPHPFSTLKALRGVTGCGSFEALQRMHRVGVWTATVESIWASTNAFLDVADEVASGAEPPEARRDQGDSDSHSPGQRRTP